MSILISNEIYNTICAELRDAKDSVQIISAYCKKNTLKSLMDQIHSHVLDKKLMVRFRLDDLLKGSTDFEVLEMGLKDGWNVYVRFDLHAKTYIVDNKRGIVGSANATTSGMLGQGGNFEIATLDTIDSSDLSKIQILYRDAIHVDENILAKLKIQYESCDSVAFGKNKTWEKNITELFTPQIDTLFSHELPDKNKYSLGEYIGFIDMTYNEDTDVREAFRWSPAYLWLMDVLEKNNGVLYFGALSQKLHDTLINDPKPYRKDVKVMLANLLALIQLFQMEEIEIDRPNYSQRIFLRK